MAGPGIAPPTPLDPTFQSVSGTIGQDQRQALAAMAQYGSQGLAAYQQAQDQIKQSQQQALNSAIQQATSFGANPAAQAQLTSQIGDTYGGRLAGLAADQAAYQGNQQAQQGLASNYFSQAQSSLPFLQNQTNIQAASLQQKAMQQAITDQLSNEKLQLDIQNAQKGPQLTPYEQWEIQQATAAQGQPDAIIKNQGGAATLGNSLFGQSTDLANQANQTVANPAQLAERGYTTDNSPTYYENYGGQNIGLPEGMGSQLASQSPDAQQAAYNSAFSDFSNAVNGVGPNGAKLPKALTPTEAYTRLVNAYGQPVADKVMAAYTKVKAL